MLGGQHYDEILFTFEALCFSEILNFGESCIGTTQSKVYFGLQLVTCCMTYDTHGKPSSRWPVAGPFRCILTSSQHSGVQIHEAYGGPYTCCSQRLPCYFFICVKRDWGGGGGAQWFHWTLDVLRTALWNYQEIKHSENPLPPLQKLEATAVQVNIIKDEPGLYI
jgi:hypothetical protein